jgi:hypothetical protein
LWLAAGTLGLEAEAPWAQGALLRAVELDPLSPFAAFLAAQAVAPAPQAIELGLHSVTLDARLARAVWWNRRPDIARQVGRLSGLTMAPELDPADQRLQILALDVDRTPATSYSLYAFRRLPWPETLVAIELRR